MAKYRVHVCRIGYSHLDIEVEAQSSARAMVKAEQEAGDHLFPSENTSEYKAQGCSIVDGLRLDRPGSIEEATEDGFTRSFR